MAAGDAGCRYDLAGRVAGGADSAGQFEQWGRSERNPRSTTPRVNLYEMPPYQAWLRREQRSKRPSAECLESARG